MKNSYNNLFYFSVVCFFYLCAYSTHSFAVVFHLPWFSKNEAPSTSSSSKTTQDPSKPPESQFIRRVVTLRSEKPGHFGIQSNTLADGTTFITQVSSGSPAYKLGIRKDDQILAIDGFSVSINRLVLTKLVTETEIKITTTRSTKK